MKIFEYLAVGRPVVASRTPALEGVLGQEIAYFCNPDDPESLANAIRIALVTPHEERVLRGRKVAEEHSWRARAHRIGVFLDSLRRIA